ncbi:uncharacterized protein ARMOST_17745 [Armillaria ostoyae]|uniref:Uncharacterized protein n=1 Tax=Armillaria ostoyae TaxID=47428 RepID=A0A284RZU6_ARMOS|nr:uncharacterized protein ARMOST_17745 [Armillaria ostoyae]
MSNGVDVSDHIDGGQERDDTAKPCETDAEDTEYDGAPIVLPPFPKGWVRGSRLTLLESFQVPFAYRCAQGVTARKDYALIATNNYLCVYYWDDPLTKEPTEPPPPPHLEVLMPRRKALKAAKIAQITASIYNWLDYRWKHPKSGPAPILTNQRNLKVADPLHLLLCNVTGLNIGWSRALTAAEHWSKENYEAVKVDMDNQFAALPAEEREKYEVLAKEEGRLAREEKQRVIANAGELLNPSEAQRAIDCLPMMLGPFLKKLGLALGLHACLYLAGPEPRKGGQLNVLSLHAGFDRSPLPLEFPEAMPGHYASSVRLFEQFVETCYTDDDKLARSLPPEELAAYTTSDAGHDEVEDEDEQPKKKKKKKAGKKKVEKQDTKGTKKAGVKKKGLNVPISDPPAVLQNDPPAIPQNDLSSSHPLADVTNKVVMAVPTKKTKSLFALDNIDPALWDAEEVEDYYEARRASAGAKTGLHSLAMSFGDVAPITGPNDNLNPFAVSPEHPDAPLFRSSPVPEARHSSPLPDSTDDADATLSPSLQLSPINQVSTHASDALLLESKCWAEWYVQIHRTIDALELPGQWSMITMYLTLLEGRNGWDMDNPKPDILDSTHQPDWVSHWIRCGWKVVPHHQLKDLTMMSEEWWGFWKSLQPEWRGIDTVKGPLSASHRGGAVKGEWGELSKRGINGMITVVVGLAFWGLVASGGTWRQKDIWENAVEETKWVLQCMALD